MPTVKKSEPALNTGLRIDRQSGRMRKLIAGLLVFCGLLCRADVPAVPAATGATTAPAMSVTLLGRQTLEKLGACQGASQHDGFIYLYGDASPGIIRQYTVGAGGVPSLNFTGLEIALTVDGQNVINHPTGLTWNPQFGTYLGNTVTKTKKGTIYHLDWPRMLIDKNLDHAILNTVDDDLAVQGCRPEFVRHGDRWLLATADYGHVNNEVRMYDPALMATAHKTSEPGVLVEHHPCLPWVQQLHWIDERGILLMIENQIEGRRWRLVPIDPWTTADFRTVTPDDELPGLNELEGGCLLDPTHCLLVTSSRADNASVGTIEFTK
jgi:hypothetical protein